MMKPRASSSRFVICSTLIILCFIIKLPYAVSPHKQLCTHESLLIAEDDAVRLMSNMLSPIIPDKFLTRYFERQPAAVLDRPPGYYSGLIDLNVIARYLQSQRPTPVSELHEVPKTHSQSVISSLEESKIVHGGDWKLVKRVWRDGEWWSSMPNASMIPLPAVYASFQRDSYSIVIDKIQIFHPPIRKVTKILESLFGCQVNANLYLTPYGANQAFETHFDWMDGFVVQVMGCKQWKVYSTPASIRPLPDTVYKIKIKTDNNCDINDNKTDNRSCDNNITKDSDYNDLTPEKKLEFQGYNLGPGSLLYIPRGTAHEAATNCSRRSSRHESSKDVKKAERTKRTKGRKRREGMERTEIAVDGSAVTAERDEGDQGDEGEESEEGVEGDERVERDEGGESSGSNEGGDIASDAVSSLHVTFGLESPTDSTLEIFLHHCVDIYFNIMRGQDPRDSDDNQCEKDDHCSNEKNSREDRRNEELNTIFENSSLNTTIRMDNISISDLFHLIIHIAATTEDNIKHNSNENSKENLEKPTEHSTKMRRKSEDKKRKSNIQLSGSSILRQSLAVTNYTANNNYQPMVYNVLPDGLNYLRYYLSSTSINDIIVNAVILGLNMGYITPNFDNIEFNNGKANKKNIINNAKTEKKMIQDTRKKNKVSDVQNDNKEDKNLNYIKYFMSSTASIEILSGTDTPYLQTPPEDAKNDENNQRKWISAYLHHSSWDISTISTIANNKTEIDLKSLFMDFITTLGGEKDDSDQSQQSSKSGIDTYSNDVLETLSHNLYCNSWKSLTDQLKADRSSYK